MTTRTDRLQAVFLAILLAIGAGLAWGITVALTLPAINSVAFRPSQTSERIVVLRDGTPLVESSVGQLVYRTDNYRTLDGERTDAAWNQFVGNSSLSRPGWSRGWFVRRPWRERITLIHYDQSGTDVWYAVHDGNLEGHAYLAGYDKSTMLKIGYIGRRGFRTDVPPKEEQFPVNGRSFRNAYLQSHHLLTDAGLVRIDWNTREVKLIWPDRNPISVATNQGHTPDDETGELKLLVRTLDWVRVLDANGDEREAYPLPAELRDASALQWTPLPGGKALVWRVGDDSELFWLDASGIVRREKVDLHKVGRTSNRTAATFLSLAVPVPAIFAAVTATIPLKSSTDFEAGNYWVRLIQALADVWPGLLTVVAVGVVLAWLCYRRQRKFGLPWTPVWTVLVLLFGLPAYFGYVAHRQWPACLSCPSCGRPVPRDRPACCACHRDFPAPAPNGTEVFA